MKTYLKTFLAGTVLAAVMAMIMFMLGLTLAGGRQLVDRNDDRNVTQIRCRQICADNHAQTWSWELRDPDNTRRTPFLVGVCSCAGDEL